MPIQAEGIAGSDLGASTCRFAPGSRRNLRYLADFSHPDAPISAPLLSKHLTLHERKYCIPNIEVSKLNLCGPPIGRFVGYLGEVEEGEEPRDGVHITWTARIETENHFRFEDEKSYKGRKRQ